MLAQGGEEARKNLLKPKMTGIYHIHIWIAAAAKTIDLFMVRSCALHIIAH